MRLRVAVARCTLGDPARAHVPAASVSLPVAGMVSVPAGGAEGTVVAGHVVDPARSARERAGLDKPRELLAVDSGPGGILRCHHAMAPRKRHHELLRRLPGRAERGPSLFVFAAGAVCAVRLEVRLAALASCVVGLVARRVRAMCHGVEV